MTDNKKWYTLAAACLALFMAILDNLVVNVALPTISRDLQASTTQLQWIVSAYTLVFASIQITAGGLGDRLGRKRWFLGGLALFTVSSLFGAFAQNVGMLIAARALQGLGAAFIMPLTLSLISVAFPPEERGRAIGIWSAISVSGLAFGPIIGGALVQYASWHWVFLINVPIGILTFILSFSFVRESRDESGNVAFDLPGTLLITGAVASLTWALIEAGDRGWGDTFILAAFALAAVLLAGFIAVESRVARPMVPLGFFRSSTFTGANIDSFAISFAIGGVAFFLTLYQQNVHGFSPVRSGMSLLPLVLMMMAGAPLSGVLVARIGARVLISIGMIISGIGTLLFLRTAPDARYVDLLPAFLVLGAGNSLIFAPMTTAVLNSVESHRSGVASAVNGAVREVGTAFSIALLGTLANRVYRADYNADPAIIAARANPAYPPPLQGIIDLIGSGSSFGGRVIEDSRRFPGLPMPLVANLRDASSIAFVDGMHAAIVVSSIGMFVVSVVSFLLIRDRATVAVTAPVGSALEEESMSTHPDASVPAGATSDTNDPNGVAPYAEPAYLAAAPSANGHATETFVPYGYALNGHATNGNGNGDRTGSDPDGYSFNGYAVQAPAYEGDYSAPYADAPLPVAQWEPAYADTSFTVSPAPEPLEANGYAARAAAPATDAHSDAYATAGWSSMYAANDAWSNTGQPSASSGASAFVPPTYPPGAAWVPEHLGAPSAATSASVPAEPVVEYESHSPVSGYTAPFSTGTTAPAAPAAMMPPGSAWMPVGESPAPVPLPDDALPARVAALEQFAYEIATRSQNDEVALLTRKVIALEEIIMRFVSEVPIRLGGEIGILERRVAYLMDEMPARMHTESAPTAEVTERLDRKVGALERFAQTMPSAQWHHDHDARSEALERRVVELERFCTALARRGTAPRDIAATTVNGTVSTSAPPPTNGKAHTLVGVNANSGDNRSGIARDGERRRGRR